MLPKVAVFRRAPLHRIDSFINTVLMSIKTNSSESLSFINDIWSEIVGEVIASKAVPLALKAKKLTIKVSSSVYRSELLYRKNELKQMINKKCGEMVIEMIIFI